MKVASCAPFWRPALSREAAVKVTATTSWFSLKRESERRWGGTARCSQPAVGFCSIPPRRLLQSILGPWVWSPSAQDPPSIPILLFLDWNSTDVAQRASLLHMMAGTRGQLNAESGFIWPLGSICITFVRPAQQTAADWPYHRSLCDQADVCQELPGFRSFPPGTCPFLLDVPPFLLYFHDCSPHQIRQRCRLQPRTAPGRERQYAGWPPGQHGKSKSSGGCELVWAVVTRVANWLSWITPTQNLPHHDEIQQQQHSRRIIY